MLARIINHQSSTDTGYIKMADAWLDALDDILPICP
jgi:hypothetical protein